MTEVVDSVPSQNGNDCTAKAREVMKTLLEKNTHDRIFEKVRKKCEKIVENYF